MSGSLIPFHSVHKPGQNLFAGGQHNRPARPTGCHLPMRTRYSFSPRPFRFGYWYRLIIPRGILPARVWHLSELQSWGYMHMPLRYVAHGSG